MKTFRNKKASHNYYFISELEAGIVLTGTEIKSIRQGKINFKDSFAKIKNGEVWLHNLHISQYEMGTHSNHEPERVRKLLLNKREIKKLQKNVDEKGMSLVPKSLYINEKGLVKISLALAKGKNVHDKRDVLQKKDIQREMDRRNNAKY